MRPKWQNDLAECSVLSTLVIGSKMPKICLKTSLHSDFGVSLYIFNFLGPIMFNYSFCFNLRFRSPLFESFDSFWDTDSKDLIGHK